MIITFIFMGIALVIGGVILGVGIGLNVGLKQALDTLNKREGILKMKLEKLENTLYRGY